MFTGTCLALQPCPAASPLDGALQKHLEASRQEARCPAPTRSGHPKSLGSARGAQAGAGRPPWGPGSCSAPGLPPGAWVPPTCSHPCSVPRACRKSRWMDQFCFFFRVRSSTLGFPRPLCVSSSTLVSSWHEGLR